MRLRLVHQLSLLLLAAVLLAVAGVGGAVWWNLRSGFTDYLRSRDAERLEGFAAVVARHAQIDPDLSHLRGSREAMRALLAEFAGNEGMDPLDGPPPRPAGAPTGSHRPGMGPGMGGGAPGAGPAGAMGSRGSPDAFTARLQVFDPQGQWVAGRPQPADRAVLRAPVLLDGRTVAEVRLTLLPEPAGVDARFLQRQYLGQAVAAALSLAVALLAGAWVARRMSAPLQAAQTATHRIARGEFAVRVPEAGAREMAGLIADLNRMAESLQRLEGARRHWLAQISHELRTPLAVLRGELEAIEDGIRTPDAARIASLRDEVLQLVRLVGDLHTVALSDLRTLPCDFARADASALAAQALAWLQPRLDAAGLHATLQAPARLPVRWDAGRIEQLLANLLENSLRYTDAPGRLALQLAAQPRAGTPGVAITLDDSAPGVAAGTHAQLFEPLYRADAARSRVSGYHGSGLGLSIARAIVQAHGGTIEAADSPLGGLRIAVWLPAQPDASALAGDTA